MLKQSKSPPPSPMIKKPASYSYVYDKNAPATYDEYDNVGEDEITKKIPQFNFDTIPDKTIDEFKKQSFSIKIVILQCKPNYQEFYQFTTHAVILKAETQHSLFAIPIKAPYTGTLEWSKNVWTSIYDFTISLDTFKVLFGSSQQSQHNH